MQQRPQWIGQSLRFAAVAPIVFAVDWSVLHLVGLAGVPALAGRCASLGASVAVGFLLNRAFTFRAEGRPSLAEFRRYVLAAGLGIAVNYGVFAAAHRFGLADPVAIGAGMLAAAAVTFTRFRAIFAR